MSNEHSTGRKPQDTDSLDARDSGYFTEESSIEAVTQRNKNAKDDRVRFAMDVITRKLHEAVLEIEPTPDEWLSAIQFLTQTGHLCDDWRQEFILLSDVLGVTMLVDAVNHRRPSGASENSVLGPFHVKGSPTMEMGANICQDGKGEPMLVHGRILDTRGQPIHGARIDVWQANEDGFYDVQQKGIQPEFNLRGNFNTAADGRFWFRGVKPKFYPIPDDGTVGSLLNVLGRHPYRPAHLHFIIEAEGFSTITTHIFDPHDPYINSDAVFGVKKTLLAEFKRIADPVRIKDEGFGEPFWDVEYDFVMAVI